MAETVTRVTTTIPASDLKTHFDLDANGDVTVKGKDLSELIKAKLNTPGGAGAATQAIRVAVDTG